MLRPWSKPVVMSLSPQGVAIRENSGKFVLITQENLLLNNIDLLLPLFEKQQSVLKNQQIKVIVSNHFVRYLVLPWQTEVYRLQDWQAIAQHLFKKEFGAMVQAWQVDVHLGQFGQSVLAAAMNQDLLQKVQRVAQHIGFKVKAVTPVLSQLAEKLAKSQQHWLFIAEPERLLLANVHQGAWQQILIDAPPKGSEYLQARQLLQRALVQRERQDQAIHITMQVSSTLQSQWPRQLDDEIGRLLKINNPIVMSQLQSNQIQSNQQQPMQQHALWMASL